ncbi:hypothetical protein CB0940_07994 [Cercospora beticola]|uniref:Beta-lactamase-related domain-containing protein n=1 Tax=Cercospora beticola TaxID=122368 RepID=A0A2G5HNG6_CERBT|nr:hypothetical protein CB0940_07994 [Cercospora beticola]PIA94101.1 hypothetical protein CB0940_07994 [Cercospora beticola]WPB04548.1 hypothetical protein RHO25_009194 [Cercospora beticola]CAK1364292.1 unnamed protein product [Cercospora beticola]
MWSPAYIAVALLALGFQSGATEFHAGFDDLVEDLLTKWHLPGLRIAVVRGGETKSKGYGYARLPDVRATPDTLWFTGSTTKAFVATAAGRLVQNDSVPDFKWSSRLSDLLPGEFVLSEEYQTLHTTLEDALSHRSGLPRHDTSYGWGDETPKDIVKRLRYLPLTSEPRTRFQYCNIMFATVGVMLERHTGLQLESLLHDWIWKPLGMKSTTFSVQQAIGSGDLAAGYYWDEDGETYIPEPYYDILPVAGAGATISSVNDYSLSIKALLESAKKLNHEAGPLTPELLQALWTPRSYVDLGFVNTSRIASSVNYALGWMVVQVDKYTVITHSGGLPGFGTQVFLVPELDFGFTSMGNEVGRATVVGAQLFLLLLKEIRDEIVIEEHFGLQKVLEQVRPLFGPPMHSGSRTKQAGVKADSTTLPLPGDIGAYLGLYSHPAYGPINISLAENSSTIPLTNIMNSQLPLTGRSATPQLLVTPTPRVFSTSFVLTHTSTTFFDAQGYWIHGPTPGNDQVTCGNGQQSADTSGTNRNLKCKDEAVWQKAWPGKAVFEYSPDGKVATLGIEIEEEQIRVAGETGNWRDGMIWFAKVSE